MVNQVRLSNLSAHFNRVIGVDLVNQNKATYGQEYYKFVYIGGYFYQINIGFINPKYDIGVSVMYQDYYTGMANIKWLTKIIFTNPRISRGSYQTQGKSETEIYNPHRYNN